MNLEESFKKSSEDVKTLPSRPGNEDMLKLYSLYKQATVGEVDGKRPGMINMVARAKYDAWASLQGTSKEAAMQKYIDLVESLFDA